MPGAADPPANPPPDAPVTAGLPRDVAVPRLLALHGDRLYGLASCVCGTAEEAKDLVQETFLQAWRAWDRFDGRAEPQVWLFTIARHACQRMHRRRAGEPARLESLDDSGPFGAPKVAFVPAGSDAFDDVVRREQVARLGTAITELPDDFRLPIVLKDIVGMPVDDVARVLDLPPGTVKTRVHRARLRLRDVLAAGLPVREMPPAAYSRQVCLDLLRTKQDCLDRGVPMPDADGIVCERCRAVFATLDLTVDVCAGLAAGTMPDELRAELLRRLAQPA